MKKAIVFGATGQLGCYSALILKDAGYHVVAVGRRKLHICTKKWHQL